MGAPAKVSKASARTLCVRIGQILPSLLPTAVIALNLPQLTLEASSGPSHPHAALFPARVVTLHAPGATMLRIPAGRFEMGSTLKAIMGAAELCQKDAPTQACRPQLFANEQPLHTVELSAFWLDRTEVTVEAYERCVEQRRCAEPPYVEGAARFREANFPVSFVTWEDAQNYCRWRGARLPTEAEFERASRGLNRRRFPWGEFYNSHLANHGRYGIAATDASDGFEELAPVGSFANGRTPDGFMDLAGNVAEWVSDRYEPRYPEASKDPQGPAASATNRDRVTRGGHFRSPPVWLRGAARDFHEPGERLPYLGFRCARSSFDKDRS
jgi:formylglycine-generating enzyme